MVLRGALVTAFLALMAGAVRAEMLEFPAGDVTKVWPKLPAVAEWHQDQAASFQNTANALIPDGVTFDSADAVILARGLPRAGRSLAQVMADDKTGNATDDAHTRKLADIADKDVRPFQVIAFAPGKSGKWEADAYAEEGRYYLVFTLSAKSQAAYDKAFPVFSGLLQNYAEMIPW